MKKAVSILIVLAAVLTLAACGGGGGKVRDDVKVDALTAKVAEAVPSSDTMMAADDSYLKNLMLLDKSVSAEHVVMLSTSGLTIDEFGIFKGADKASTETIAKEIEGYLKMRDETWMVEYMPEERPKVQNAEFKTVGNYVMYAILSDGDKAAAFDVFEGELQAK